MYYKQIMPFVFLLMAFTGFTQKENYSKISLPSTTHLAEIVNLGIDIHCGLYIDQNTGEYEMIVSDDEIQLLNNRLIDYNILVSDASTYYANRSANDYNNAENQLRLSKEAAPQPIHLQRLLEGNDDCIVDNFATPQNFNLGSMGGMLKYSEILAELDEMAQKYPNIISVKKAISQKRTVEGRPIYYVKISDNPNQNENEPEVLYDALHHAREPNGMMNLIFYMWYLLENYDSDTEIKTLVDNTEMYFIPCINVDGYLHNEKTDPYGGGLWRKNRQRNSDGSYGVDLNRNYGYDWAKGGSSSNPGSDTYHGPKAFSEPETQMIKEFTLKHDFKTAFNYHSYSGMILYPFGSNKPTTNLDYFYKIGEDVTQTNRYIYGDVSTVIYTATGGSDDWMYAGSGKEVYAFTPEIGRDSFWPSTSMILPECKDNVRANFLLAYYAGRHLQVDDLTSNVVTNQSSKIDFNLQKLGRTGQNFKVNIQPISSNISQIENSTKTVTINETLDVQKVSFDYTLNSSIKRDDIIQYKVSITCDNVEIYKKQFKKLYQPTVVFNSNEENVGLNQWDSEWGIAADAYSGSSSISHAPNGNYQNNEQKIITTKNAVDLTGAKSAQIEFYAKWAIERMYDFAQIRVRKEGSNTWQPLCTPYTKPGAPNRVSGFNRNSDQPTDKPIYDGRQNSWVLETIDLSNYIGSKIFIRFVFDSDRENRAQGYNNVEAGFYFDEFKVFATGKDGDDGNNPTDPTTCKTIDIEIQTDRYGGETSWELKNKSGDVVLSGKNYVGNKTYKETKCIPLGCYTFTINDSYGDGICCSYGNGGYTISVEGKQVAQGGEFAKTDQKQVCLKDEQPDTQAPNIPLNLKASAITSKSLILNWSASEDNVGVVGYKIYQNGKEIATTKSTELKVDGLTANTNYQFTVSAFDGANNESKQSAAINVTTASEPECSVIRVEFTTDNYPNETAWNLKDESGKTIFEGGTNLEKNKAYTIEKCLPKACYTFNVTDSYGDGICCSYGNGGYKIYIDNKVVAQGGDFDQSETKTICSNQAINRNVPDTLLTNTVKIGKNPIQLGEMISFETSIENGKYFLTTSQGDIVIQHELNQNQHQFSSSELQAGIYYLVVESTSGEQVSKTIVIQ